jgi:hypothetical protein
MIIDSRKERCRWNHLGVEIREALVADAITRMHNASGLSYISDALCSFDGVVNLCRVCVVMIVCLDTSDAETFLQEKMLSPLKNLHFMTCNFAASARALLCSLPAGCVKLVSIQVRSV